MCADLTAAGAQYKPHSAKQVKKNFLTDLFPKEKPWDRHRDETDQVQQIYSDAQEFERYAERMQDCSGFLKFDQLQHYETGELRTKLVIANFCRVRQCPVCQWRRALTYQARFLGILPEIEMQHPTARWLFLTLTVKNCKVSDLRDKLKSLSQSWNRFQRHKVFENILGWVRTTEITRNDKTGEAHPHFHCLLLVPSNYFTKNYVRHSAWVAAWQKAARLDYPPMVNIKPVKPKKEGTDGLREAISETLKYSVKPSDMVADNDWFYELTRQIKGLRFIATGGVLKNVLKDVDIELGDAAEETETRTGQTYEFDWSKDYRRYVKDE